MLSDFAHFLLEPPMELLILADAHLPPRLVVGPSLLDVRIYLRLMIEVISDCAINFGQLQRRERLLNGLRRTSVKELLIAVSITAHILSLILKWEKVGVSQAPSLRLRSLVSDPFDASRIYAGSFSGGVYMMSRI